MLYLLYTSGTTAKPKGIMHTTAGYLLGTSYTHEMVFDVKPDDVYWCAADIGWVTGHSLHRLRAAGQRHHRRHVRGRARHAGVGPLVADRRGLQGHASCTCAPTAIRAFMKQGEEWPAKHDLSSLRAARLGRRADQPRGLALVPEQHRRRQVPHRRHVVADRDRHDPDHAAPGRHDDQARQRHVPVPGHRGATSSTPAARACRSAAAAISC